MKIFHFDIVEKMEKGKQTEVPSGNVVVFEMPNGVKFEFQFSKTGETIRIRRNDSDSGKIDTLIIMPEHVNGIAIK